MTLLRRNLWILGAFSAVLSLGLIACSGEVQPYSCSATLVTDSSTGSRALGTSTVQATSTDDAQQQCVSAHSTDAVGSSQHVSCSCSVVQTSGGGTSTSPTR